MIRPTDTVYETDVRRTGGNAGRESAAERVCRAVLAYVGEKPLEMLAKRDAGDTLIGSLADQKWVRVVEALAAWKASSGGNA